MWLLCKRLHKLPSEILAEPSVNVKMMNMIVEEEV